MTKKNAIKLIEMYFEGYRRLPDAEDRDFIELEQVGLEDMPAHDDDEWERIYSDSHRAG